VAKSASGIDRQGGKTQRQHYPTQPPSASDPIIHKILKNIKNNTIVGAIAQASSPGTLALTAKSRTRQMPLL
jgi:hypothetical protein